MKRAVIGCLAPLMLAGCLGGGTSTSTAPAPAVSHSAFVASLNGAYIWNCTMMNDAGEAWQFVLSKGSNSRWTPVVLREAGARFDLDTEVRRFGAATVYELRDTSEILIAADGEARGEGQQTTKPHDFPNGQCTRGSQPLTT